jgi:hypothetical protein
MAFMGLYSACFDLQRAKLWLCYLFSRNDFTMQLRGFKQDWKGGADETA